MNQTTQTQIQVKKLFVKGQSRVVFVGTGTFRLPDEDAREIIDEAKHRFDIDSVEDDATLAVATVATDPEHRLVGIEWVDEQ